jgi:GNAT superfamily N-acetyltransferase
MTDGVHALADLDGATVPAASTLSRPDDALGLVRDGAVVASCALWWRQPLHAGGETAYIGRIGHVDWATEADGATLLAAALDRLRAEGVDRVVGPLDGSTWFGYRVVTDPAPDGGEPALPFALEPWPPAVVGSAFEAAGFGPVDHYLSSRVDALPDESARLDAEMEELADGLLTIRAFQIDVAEAELRALHPLLLEAFAENPYYAPLDVDRFLALYQPLLAQVDPDLVLVAEQEGWPVGVVLAVPDAAQAARGEAVDTVVVKTLAVAPETRGRGLGGALVRAVQEAARAKGYRSAIHALMHTENDSVKISRHLGRPIRRYALLGRSL